MMNKDAYEKLLKEYWQENHAPLIRSRHMVLYKCVLNDWLIELKQKKNKDKATEKNV